MIKLLLLLTLFVAGCSCTSLTSLDWTSQKIAEDDYYVLSYQPQGSSSIQEWSFSGTVPSTGRKYTLHVGSLTSGLPAAFSFELPKGG